jgi:hypothetical protein
MKLKNIFATSVIVLSASLWAESAKAFLLIDNFDTVDQGIVDNNTSNTNPTSATGTGLASDILGTVRDIRALAITANPPATFTRAFIDTGGNSGNLLQFSRLQGSSNTSYRVDYDSTPGFALPGLGVVDGTTITGLGNIDFIQGDPTNNVGIIFDITNVNDLGVGSFATLSLFSDTGTKTASATVNNLESLTALDNLVFLFSSFSGSLDATKISAIRFDVTIIAKSDGSGGFSPATIAFEQVQIQQIPFEFSPVLGISVLGGLYGLNQIRKKKANSVK